MRPTVIETDVYVNSIGPVDPINMVCTACYNTGFLSACLLEKGSVWFKIVYGEAIFFKDCNYYCTG